MEYRYLTTSLTGCVQQLACNILPHGYWFYCMGRVPDKKDPLAIDAKLLGKYGIEISRQQRLRRKVVGTANLHYIRFERTWVLLATHGMHAFFAEEESSIRDARKVPIKLGDYSLSVKHGGFLKKSEGEDEPIADGKMPVRVQIARERFNELRNYFIEQACHRSVDSLAKELYCLPFEPYAPIRRQQLELLRVINQERQAAGYEKVLSSVLRYKRRIVSPYEPSSLEVKGERIAA